MNTWSNCELPGAVTVTAAVPLRPSLVAVIVTGPPAATPVTSPLASTVATAGVPLAHVTVRPVSGLPLASCGVAVSCTVRPACTLGADGLTTTVATGTGAHVTVTLAASLLAPGWLVAGTGKAPQAVAWSRSHSQPPR